MGIISYLFTLLQDMALSAIPAAGFAMVFNVPQRALRWCALLGAIGHGSRMVMMTAGFNIEWATFLAALLVGSIGIQWSRWYLAHPKIFTVAAVIPMFPGISAYTAMISAVKISHFGYSEEMMIMLLSNFLKASSIVGALSIGLSIPGLWLYRKRPRYSRGFGPTLCYYSQWISVCFTATAEAIPTRCLKPAGRINARSQQ